jgi:cytochrome-b5 reductase
MEKKHRDGTKRAIFGIRMAVTINIKQRTSLLSLILFIQLLLQLFTMSSASASSLAGEPTMWLVPPGQCQFTNEFTSVPLLERIPVSATSTILRFGLPDTSKPLDLSTCACILAKASIEDEDVVRPYTPISTNALNGCFDLLIKNYGKTAKMSHHMCETLKVGDTVDFKHVVFNVKIQAPFPQKKIVMLVGGTGITPMIQALHAILGDTSSKNQVTMLYGSRVASDILGKELIDAWDKEYSDERFTNVHILSQEPDDSSWTGMRGHINKELVEKYVPDPSVGDDLMIFVCGPPPMYDALCGPRGEQDEIKGLLAEMGYKASQVYKF